MGNKKELNKELQVLNRVIRYVDHGIEYEADSRHAEIIAIEMGVSTGNPVSSPGTDDPNTSEGEQWDKWSDTKYRAVAARANYLALDRPDIQYSVKEMCRGMSEPA